MVGVPFLVSRWRFRPVAADRLALALLGLAASGSVCGPNTKLMTERGQDRAAGAEGDVAEDIEGMNSSAKGTSRLNSIR